MQAIFELRKAVQVRLGTYTPPTTLFKMIWHDLNLFHFFKKSKLACIITLIEFPFDFEIPDSIRTGVIATTPQEIPRNIYRMTNKELFMERRLSFRLFFYIHVVIFPVMK